MIHGTWLAGGRDDLSAVLRVREASFGCGALPEDETSLHAAVALEDVVVASARLALEEPGVYRVSYLSVVPELRGRKLGDLALRMVLDRSVRLGGFVLRADVPEETAGFFTRFGFAETDSAEDGVLPLVLDLAHINWQRACERSTP